MATDIKYVRYAVDFPRDISKDDAKGLLKYLAINLEEGLEIRLSCLTEETYYIKENFEKKKPMRELYEKINIETLVGKIIRPNEKKSIDFEFSTSQRIENNHPLYNGIEIRFDPGYENEFIFFISKIARNARDLVLRYFAAEYNNNPKVDSFRR
ncbi:MAG: hypothetical protein WC867_03625 [Candidatus Pacearchaeota archaeon]|jgi:hypothetical protein